MIEAYLGNMRAGHFGFRRRTPALSGNRHQLRARCFYADAVVAVRMEDRIAAAAKAAQIASHLLVQPDVLEARAVIDAVDHLGHPLHPWLVADRRARVEEDRPDVINRRTSSLTALHSREQGAPDHDTKIVVGTR